MKFIFSTDPDRFEDIEAVVLRAAPHAKIKRLETPLMWPEMEVEFFWLDLTNVVEAIQRAIAMSTERRS